METSHLKIIQDDHYEPSKEKIKSSEFNELVAVLQILKQWRNDTQIVEIRTQKN